MRQSSADLGSLSSVLKTSTDFRAAALMPACLLATKVQALARLRVRLF